MEIGIYTIDIENIEQIVDTYYATLSLYSIKCPELKQSIKKSVYDIFNTITINKNEALKELIYEIDQMRDFLQELVYGHHELK